MVLAAAVALTGALWPATASAAGKSIVVTDTSDGVPGSLRDAIAHAAPGDTVIVPRGNYVLTGGELMVQESLTIQGAGADITTIDAEGHSRVFHTSGAGNQITIAGVTIEHGDAGSPVSATVPVVGGGVLNEQATLTLSRDVIKDSQADASRAASDSGGIAEGGGVGSMGQLTIVDTDVSGNKATSVGPATQRGGSAIGGGVSSGGQTDVRRSTFENNVADARGGPGAANGGLAQGAGIALGLTVASTISDTTFHDNLADASAVPGGGDLARAFGAGASLNNGNGSITQTNVTYVHNVVQTSGGQSFGGGVYLFGPRAAGQSLTNVTLVGNSATRGGHNQGGNLFVEAGNGATLENTVIAAGTADAGLENCSMVGTLTSLGHNIDSRDQCNLRASGDLINKDPMLGALGANGGPVETVPLLPGSPALDAAAAAACPPTDARGALRPTGAGCDIGAFEVATPSATTAPAGSVATNTAVLNGRGSNPDPSSASASFQYGTTTAYGASTPAQSVNPTTLQAPVSVPVAGLSPGTTYHFRIVVHNAAGTVTGADQTFTTTTSHGTNGGGSPPPPLRLALRSVSTAGATMTVQLACAGSAAQQCTGNLLGRTKERLRGRSVLSVSANARSAASRAVRTKTVTVASGTYRIPAGQTAALRITVNPTGRRLLARFYRLPTRLVLDGPNRTARTVAFAYGRLNSKLSDHWSYPFQPCAPCLSIVDQLTVAGTPTGARVTVSCRGAGCPFSQHTLMPNRRRLMLATLFKHRPLYVGTTVEVLITAPNKVGEAALYTVRPGTSPQVAVRCLPPGETRLAACRGGP